MILCAGLQSKWARQIKGRVIARPYFSPIRDFNVKIYVPSLGY